MKIVLCSVLALLQVLICTLGQGALTLCVRKNGTQRLEWTWATSCKDSNTKGSCPCGCSDEENSCSDEQPSSNQSIPGIVTCNSCTDYTLVAVLPAVTVEKNHYQTLAETSYLFFPVAFESSSYALSKPSHLQPFDQQSHLKDSLATIISSVVIRC
jgi:hypothetical protein